MKFLIYTTVIGSSFIAGLQFTAIIITMWLLIAFITEAVKTNCFQDLN